MKKTVLVTGGAGFIGHHFVEHILKNTDWDIVLLDSLNYAGNLNRLSDIIIFNEQKYRIKTVYHNLQAPIHKGIRDKIGTPNFIIHMAAETHVDRSLEDAIPFVASNVVGTTNLLQYVRDFLPNLERFINFSTDEVFGPAPEGIFFKEDAPLKPSNPYAASKAGQELIGYSFCHAFKLPIITVRCMNVIGERQDKEKFIPKTIKALANSEEVVLHGKDINNISSRCWIHARNVADALLYLLSYGTMGEYYHIVGEEKSVYEIAEIIQSVVGVPSIKYKYIDFHEARPGHDKRYALDGSKLKKLGWDLPVDLYSSLVKTVEWTLQHKEWI